MKQKVILIASVIIGLLAAFISSQYIRSKEQALLNERLKLQKQYQQIEVVVLTAPLVEGTVLKMSDLGRASFPERSLRGDVIRLEANIALNLVGRSLAQGVERGRPLLWTDIEGGNLFDGGLSTQLKSHMRAISINVGGASAVSGMVRPTDRVDVIGTFSLPSKANPTESELVTMTILQDVSVLATGRNTAYSANQAATNYSTLTLEVSPHEAEVLIFAEQMRGRLAVSLRNPEDMSYEKALPEVNFTHISKTLESLNDIRQKKILRKRQAN